MGIDRLHILTDEQLVRMAQEGSETAEEILIEKYKPLVKSRSKTYFIAGADSEDVVQEGMIGLFKAIRKFDFNKEAGFGGFAELCVNSQIITAVKRANRQKHQPLNQSISFNAPADSEEEGCSLGSLLQAPDEDNPETVAVMKEQVEALKEQGTGLFSELEWRVWNEKLKGAGISDIARALGISVKSVDNAMQRIKKKVLAFLEE